ncbi:MFS transporter [Tianweitania sp.]|uniref:MFS transporter n=1 Tax=Tianweitania sp. TaxID=2021634 RepID=UPI002899A9C0|nr:MFS transporter [Tianweitania sp.]
MTTLHNAEAGDRDRKAFDDPAARGQLIRWFVSAAAISVPQAAGPVTFSLLALVLTGDTSGGAALILAMTVAQVLGAIPITRLGRNRSATRFLQGLIAIRTIALLLMAVLAAYGAPFLWLFLLTAVAGSVHGAAWGYLRSVLNGLTPASKLPRALGISATLNEVTFVLAPVAASGLGTLSPIFAVVAMAVLGAIPALLVPHVSAAPVEDTPHAEGSVLSPSILLWLMCSAAGGSAIAAIEIGAVALAIGFGYPPALAILFTVPLCLASVAGGIWVSVRNRAATRGMVVGLLCVMTGGAWLAAIQHSLALTIVGAVLIGAVLAPLATYYSLILDILAPPNKRPEVFALLRTANAIGIIFASAVLTATSLSVALLVVASTMLVVTLIVGAVSFKEKRRA